jgi:hypothetical protein
LGDAVPGIMRAYGQGEKRIEREAGRDFGKSAPGENLIFTAEINIYGIRGKTWE